MTAGIAVLTPWEPVTRAAQVMRDRGVAFVPVVDHRSYMRLKGVITERDLVVRHLAEGHSSDCLVGSHMTIGDLVSVPADLDVMRVARIMRRERVRHVVVTSGHRVVGVVTVADIVVARLPAREVAEVISNMSLPATDEIQNDGA